MFRIRKKAQNIFKYKNGNLLKIIEYISNVYSALQEHMHASKKTPHLGYNYRHKIQNNFNLYIGRKNKLTISNVLKPLK